MDDTTTTARCYWCNAPAGGPCADNCPDRPPATPDRTNR